MSNLQSVKDLYAAIGRGDLEAILGALDAGVEWREAEGNPYEPSGNAWIGKDEVTQNLLAKLGTEWDGFTVTPKAFHDAGDTVAVEGRYTGIFKGTEKSIDGQFCHVWKLADGKVKSFQQYVDTAQLENVMGAR